MEGFSFEKPYIDPELESLFERIYPPRVCIDNNAYKDCTVVKLLVNIPPTDEKKLRVDSLNKHGTLLEMVQALTELNLVISKSYICSDGGWFMDVFHVTDQSGSKVTDDTITRYIQEALCATRTSKESQQNCPFKEDRPSHLSPEETALEITAVDRPGLLSELSITLTELGCHVTAAFAWTHNARAACMFFIEEKCKAGPITEKAYLTRILEKLQIVVEAHHQQGETWSVRLTAPVARHMHPERRLHQLMSDVEDNEMGSHKLDHRSHGRNCFCTVVTIESCNERGYSVVSMRCRDRPRLLFDTLCVLTDMDYVVFHAAIGSSCSIASQEYYIRRKDGWTLDTEAERRRVERCLVAAVERRASHGLQLDISATNRTALLSDITRALRECGLSVARLEMSARGENAAGTFYVRDASGLEEICSTVSIKEALKEINGIAQVVTKFSGFSCESITNRSANREAAEKPTLFSLGSMVWSRLESFSSNFGTVKLWRLSEPCM